MLAEVGVLTEEIEKELEKFEQDKQDQLAKLKQIEDKEELKELTYNQDMMLVNLLVESFLILLLIMEKLL